MQLVPDQKNSKLTAILMLVVGVLLVYLVCLHWFIMRHLEYAEELSDLKEQLTRFESVVAQREVLQEKLGEIRDSTEDVDMFLTEPDFNEAAAEMSNRLGQMVQDQASEDCQIVSRQPVRPRVQERFQRVTVNVRMRCRGEDLLQVLYQLETELPMVLVEDLNIVRPRARRRDATQAAGASLDIRFNMSGFLSS